MNTSYIPFIHEAARVASIICSLASIYTVVLLGSCSHLGVAGLPSVLISLGITVAAFLVVVILEKYSHRTNLPDTPSL